MYLNRDGFTTMKKTPILTICLITFLSGCDSNQDSGNEQPGMTGSDRDEHGCIGSAGYQWCERTRQCERPWELAEKEGFENTPEQFEAYCSGE
jgi:hypothetical protein